MRSVAVTCLGDHHLLDLFVEVVRSEVACGGFSRLLKCYCS